MTTFTENVIKEIQELQKLGACRNLNVIGNIVDGKHDETLNDAATNMGVSEAADLVIMLDEI